MDPINLKTTSSVNPIILNGRRMSHRSGRINKNTIANGQQTAKRMNHKISAKMNFMFFSNSQEQTIGQS